MHLTATQSYPAPPADVAAMLADADFQRWRAARCTGSGTLDAVDVVVAGGGGFTVVLRRTFVTENIPPQARALVGQEIAIRQAEVWEAEVGGERHGSIAQEIVGTPARITGTIALMPSSPDGG
ncbi:MAG: DUF2505 domain-containing protein, partial [Cellulomonadaceae bacterium]|nr:DUF2505 domain-containing protein [Cellulomonadaceae bacterium]